MTKLSERRPSSPNPEKGREKNVETPINAKESKITYAEIVKKGSPKEQIASSSKEKKSISFDIAVTEEVQKSSAASPRMNKDPGINNRVKSGPSERDLLKKTTGKIRWNEGEKKELVRCYFLGKNKNLPKIKGTYSIWRERNPKAHPNMCEVKLNTQLNYLLKSWGKDELQEIEASVGKPNEVIIKSNEVVTENNEECSTKFNEDESKLNDKDNSKLNEVIIKYKDEIITKYKEVLSEDLMVRATPNKIKYCKQNKQTVDAVNDALVEVAKIFGNELED